MDNLKTAPLPRNYIEQFIKTPRGVLAFEDLLDDTTEIYTVLNGSSFLVLEEQSDIGNERVLTTAPGELTGTDAGPSSSYTLGLADTAVTAGDYGDDSTLIRVSFDAKGRAIDVQTFQLNSDNVTEGATNLFFTQARARGALSAGDGIDYNSTTGVIAMDFPASSGTYTPVLTAVANAASVGPASSCQWLRISNVVTVSGAVLIQPTSATVNTQVGISLPVASNLGNAFECAGTACVHAAIVQPGVVVGDTVNDRAQLEFVAFDTTNRRMYFTFTYRII